MYMYITQVKNLFGDWGIPCPPPPKKIADHQLKYDTLIWLFGDMNMFFSHLKWHVKVAIHITRDQDTGFYYIAKHRISQ